jgi:hypothetical protein
LQVWRAKANQQKISKNSYKIELERISRVIQQTIYSYGKERINFIQLGEALTELKVFRELFPNDNNKESNINTFSNAEGKAKPQKNCTLSTKTKRQRQSFTI